MGEAPPIMLSPPPPVPSSSLKTNQTSEPAAAETTIDPPPLFNRKIEFHLARKPSNGFGNYGGDKGGFFIETLNPDNNNSGFNKNPSSASETKVVKAEGVDRNGIDAELLNLRVTFRRIGAGLQNLGNTCFLNSVLQCLTYTEPLAAYLQSGKHRTSCRMAGFCALCAIQRHVDRALNSTGRIVAPKDLVSNLRCISRNFRNARQEDAHEYMVNLLESMHKCCLPSGVPSESPSAYERSLVHKIFGGRLRSQVKCLQCSYSSNKFDPFLDLSLEILKADSVHKALTHFTAKEQLDGGERQYQCQQCKQKVKALKQLTIYKPPHVLAIHLKRFGSHVQGQKINKKVDFASTIDLKHFVTGPYDGDLTYTLYGVLVHAGYSTHSGHYYCFVRQSSGMWYSLDDNKVVQVAERKVLEQKAYMLFYVRDHKKVIPNKPADAILKETGTNLKVSRGSMQNGPIGRKINGSVSHISNQGDARNANASNEGLIKIPAGANMSKADQGKYLDVNAKNSASPKDSSLANLNAKIPADTKGLKADFPTSLNVNKSSSSMANLNLGEKGAASLHKASNAHAAVNGSISSVPLENGDQKIINASVAELSQLNVPQFTAKDDRCDPSMRITSCNSRAGVKKVVTDSDDTPIDSTTIGTVEQPSVSMNAQKVEICKLSGSSSHGAADVGKKPELPTTMEIFPQKRSADKTSRLTVKKKLFKTPIMKMHLSTNIIFRTAFGLRKKRKHRGSSCNSLNNNSGQEHLAHSNLNESGLGPSTSENHERPSHGLSTSSKNKKCKGNKSGGEDVTATADLKIIIGEPKQRVCVNDHLVLTEKQPPVFYKSEIASPAWSADKRKEVNRIGLTAVLGETTVPKWDDVPVPVTTFTESEKVESISIGHIGDEWDELYDTGKRKKVRMNKIDFDGQNHFQEIANRKAKRKHMMDSRPRTKRSKA